MLIYCVEDDESIRDLVGYALRGQGYGMEGFSCADDFYKGMKRQYLIWYCLMSCFLVKMDSAF